MSRYGLDEGKLRFPTDGALVPNRFVKLGSDGFPDLAAADDENVIGVTLNGVSGASSHSTGVVVALKNKGGVCEVEVAAAVTMTRGSVGYQAADGKIADTGTVRAGVCLTGGTAGQTVELLPDAGFAFAAP